MAIRFDRIELSDDGNHLYPYIEGTDGYLAVRTTSGLLRIGAGNSSYSHFYTDRASYYFNTAVAFDGNISAYDGNENLTNWNNVDASAFRSKANTAYYVDPDGTSNVNKFRFGTSSDLQTGSSKLDVAGISAMRNSSDSSATLYIQNHSSTTSTIQPYIYLADSGGNRGGLGVETSTAIMSVNGQGGLKFQPGASGVSGTEALLIDNSQNARFAGVVEQGEGKGGEWNFWLHAGSDYTGGTQVQDQWHTGYNNNQRANSSDTSFYDSTSRTFLITGIQWEIGSRVTPFEHLSYDEQLRRCQRYYFHTYFRHHYPDLATHRGAYNHNFGAMATYGEVNFFFPVSMRTTPTVTSYSPEGGQGAGSFQYWNGSSSVSTNSLYIGYHNQCHHNAKIALGSTSRSNFVGHVVAESEL